MSSSCTEPVTRHPMLTDEEFEKFKRIINFIQTDVYVISPDGRLIRDISYLGTEGVGEVVGGTGPLRGAVCLGLSSTGSSRGSATGMIQMLKFVMETLGKSVTLVHSLRKQIFTMSANLGLVAQHWDEMKNFKNFDALEFLEEYEITKIDTKEGFVAKLDEIFNEIVSIYPEPKEKQGILSLCHII